MYISTEMVVDTIIKVAALLTAITAICAAVYKLIKWIQKQEQQTKDIEQLNDEMYVVIYSMRACLDGLKQLGADGHVTKAKADLEEYLNKQVHNQKKGGTS